jgi:essential nuclear protein 1
LEGGFVGVETSEEDEAMMMRFMGTGTGERRNLTDIIMAKIKEKEDSEKGIVPTAELLARKMNPKLVKVYTEVGKFLSRYKSGKLPKVFKLLPNMEDWEELVFLTNPETWTPHATYAASRIFASNLNHVMAQRFFNIVLLPKARDDFAAEKKLHYHMYMAIKKALYKPGAFFKGFLIPAAEAGDMSLREATIIASVIKKVSIPQVHSAATLLKLTQLPYNGASAIFIRTLIDKKYALPNVVVDALAAYFADFVHMPGPMPVLWHSTLLSLAQRYKGAINEGRRKHLKDVMKAHFHHAITPEIRRELFAAPPKAASGAKRRSGPPPDVSMA